MIRENDTENIQNELKRVMEKIKSVENTEELRILSTQLLATISCAVEIIGSEEKRKETVDEVNVGDEVKYIGCDRSMVITRITMDLEDGGCSFDAIYADGTVCEDGTLRLVEKTGRSYPEIVQMFEKMREGA